MVRVAAAGVGPWDAIIREGNCNVSPSPPLVFGSDLSGGASYENRPQCFEGLRGRLGERVRSFQDRETRTVRAGDAVEGRTVLDAPVCLNVQCVSSNRHAFNVSCRRVAIRCDRKLRHGVGVAVEIGGVEVVDNGDNACASDKGSDRPNDD